MFKINVYISGSIFMRLQTCSIQVSEYERTFYSECHRMRCDLKLEMHRSLASIGTCLPTF
jgi:hypothetical protein